MASTGRPGRPDLDFESTSSAGPVRLRGFDPIEHQRMVVNPFAAVGGLLLWFQVLPWLVSGPFLVVILFFVFLALALLPLLIQYHCLDCGRTGSYLRRGRHVCPAVLSRSMLPNPPDSPIPSARSQLIVWGWILGSLWILMAVVG